MSNAVSAENKKPRFLTFLLHSHPLAVVGLPLESLVCCLIGLGILAGTGPQFMFWLLCGLALGAWVMYIGAKRDDYRRLHS